MSKSSSNFKDTAAFMVLPRFLRIWLVNLLDFVNVYVFEVKESMVNIFLIYNHVQVILKLQGDCRFQGTSRFLRIWLARLFNFLNVYVFMIKLSLMLNIFLIYHYVQVILKL
jgi:hypothetical protein